jgi:hypothetical protein
VKRAVTALDGTVAPAACRYGGAMRIPARYNGPATTGHGGYSAGLIAAHVGDGPVSVSLRAPVPLDTDLDVRATGDGVEVYAGDTLIATAEPSGPPAQPPPPITPDAAAAAAMDGDEILDGHPFPTCFGCGPERPDGLRLFAGPAGDGLQAAAWTPTDPVDEPMVWAVLDCPSAQPVADPPGGSPIVLARFTVACEAPVTPGRPYAIVAAELARDGRKRRSSVAMYDAGGARLAHGEALWIALQK